MLVKFLKHILVGPVQSFLIDILEAAHENIRNFAGQRSPLPFLFEFDTSRNDAVDIGIPTGNHAAYRIDRYNPATR